MNKVYYEEVAKKSKGIKLKYDDKQDDNKCWVELKGKDDKGKIKTTARVRIRIDVLPQHLAVKNPVGKARNTPNHSPFLP